MGSRFAAQENIKNIKELNAFRDSSGTEIALAGLDNNDAASEKYYMIPINDIVRHDSNRTIKAEDIEELAENIENNGLRQAIEITKQKYDGKYRLLSGERRWKAFQLLHERHPEDIQYNTIKAVFKDVPDDYHQILILINANTERENPSRLDEFDMYWDLKKEYSRMIENGEDPAVDFETAYIKARLEKKMKASSIRSMMNYYNHCEREIFKLIDDEKFLFSSLKTFASLNKEMQLIVIEAVNSGIKVNDDMLLGIRSDPVRAMEIIQHTREEGASASDRDETIRKPNARLQEKDDAIRMYEAGLSESKSAEKIALREAKKKPPVSRKESVWDKLGTNDAAVSKKLVAIRRPLAVLYGEERISYNAEHKKQIGELISMLQEMLSRS